METKKTFVIEPDGTLTVCEVTPPAEDGAEPGHRSWSIQRGQVAAHRRDPAFEAELPPELRAQLDELQAERDALAGLGL